MTAFYGLLPMFKPEDELFADFPMLR